MDKLTLEQVKERFPNTTWNIVGVCPKCKSNPLITDHEEWLSIMWCILCGYKCAR